MLTYLALGVGVLALLLLASRLLAGVDARAIVKALKWLALLAAVAAVAWLALSGRLWAAVVALPAMVAWLARLLRGVAVFNMFHRMTGGAGRSGGPSGQESAHPANGAMSPDEATRVLGLKPGASAAEIKAAHRRLITGLHPDKGGSDFLAQQINRAKDVLLGK